MVVVDIVLRTPAADELRSLASTLSSWQRDNGAIQLHPGDLGWFSMRGADATARALRAWFWGDQLLALGLLDGPDGLLRLGMDPDQRDDEALARQVCADITDPERGGLPAGEAVVEARGASTLQRVMLADGWQLDEPWTPLHCNLDGPVPDTLVTRTGLRIAVVGPDRADEWMEVHRSAFRGTVFGEAERAEVVNWWTTMMDGPFAERGRSLAGLDPDGRAVAIVGVWSAGRGRPGLIEPMGTHRDHRGRGYGAAICEAAASTLRQIGASSAIVCAESSNVGAVLHTPRPGSPRTHRWRTSFARTLPEVGVVSDVPDLGPVPQRITVEPEQVGRLVEEQCPQWATLPVAPVENGGWDNWTFHLGDSMLLRLPSAREYAMAVEKEHRWLPVLAASLPRPIPVPVAKGEPGAGYPFSWSVYEWIDGEPADHDTVVDPIGFAKDLADFVAALQSIDATDGPQPGQHNWFRGATLRTFDAQVHRALADLGGHIDGELALEIWTCALESQWDGIDVWFHGDLAQGNILLDDGDLTAVIDFGTCGVGDPACDLAIAWTLLSAEGRSAFRECLSVHDELWSRGRGWALWKTLVTCANNVDASDAEAINARRALDEIFTEYEAR